MITKSFQDDVRRKFNSIERRLRNAGGGGAHNLLSLTHSDTDPANPVQGDIIIADNTPDWVRLARGADNQFLRMNGNNPNWEDYSGAVGEAEIQFLDSFGDAIVYWSWIDYATSATKTITEAGGVLAIHINNGVDANWWSTKTLAPRRMTGIPGFPCFIETKITAWGSSGSDDNGGGIAFSRIDNASTANHVYASIQNTGAVTEISAGYGGGVFASVSPYAGGLPLWLRIYSNCYGADYNGFWFFYSTDGINWTEIGAGPYDNASWSFSDGMVGGLYAKNWGLLPQVDMEFDYYLARRLFGPG